MRPYRTLFLTWLASGAGAFAGSVLGGAVGKTGLFAGGLIGGLVAAAVAPVLADQWGWLPRDGRTGAVVGAMVGFGVACGLTVVSLQTPIVALLSPALAGAGALLGSGFSRRP